MVELAAEDMITALRTQRAHLLERRAEMQMQVISLENQETVGEEDGSLNLFISPGLISL